MIWKQFMERAAPQAAPLSTEAPLASQTVGLAQGPANALDQDGPAGERMSIPETSGGQCNVAGCERIITRSGPPTALISRIGAVRGASVIDDRSALITEWPISNLDQVELRVTNAQWSPRCVRNRREFP